MTSSNLDKLLATYRSLEQQKRQILQLLAFLATPISRSSLTSIIEDLKIRLNPSRTVNIPELNEFLAEMYNSGLLLQKNGSYYCLPEIQQTLMVDTYKEGNFDAFNARIAEIIYNNVNKGEQQHLAALRLAVHQNNISSTVELLKSYRRNYFSQQKSAPFRQLFPEPLDKEWLLTRNSTILLTILHQIIEVSFTNLEPTTAYTVLCELIPSVSDENLEASCTNAFYLLLKGMPEQTEKLIAESRLKQCNTLQGTLSQMRGDSDTAAAQFEIGLTSYKKEIGRRKAFLPGLTGLMHVLALIMSGLPHQLKEAVELSEIAIKDSYKDENLSLSYNILKLFAENRLGNSLVVKEIADLSRKKRDSLNPLANLICHIITRWLDKPLSKETILSIVNTAEKARAAGQYWIAAENALLAKAAGADENEIFTWATSFFEEEKLKCISTSSLDNLNKWERSLNALMSLGTNTQTQNATQKATRLIWIIEGNNKYINIQPLEQKQTAKGWTIGRNISLRRLTEDAVKLDFLTRQDINAAGCISKSNTYSYYPQITYSFNTFKTLQVLSGHPLVFNKNREPLTIAKGEFQLQVKKGGKDLNIDFSPMPADKTDTFWVWEGTNRLILYEPTVEQLKIAAIVGKGLKVPVNAEKQITAAITAVAPHVTVHSDLTTKSVSAETVESDSRLHILMRPAGSGVSVDVRIRPFGDMGTLFFAGQGGKTVITETGGKKLQCNRDLTIEKQYYKLLMDACPAFELYENDHDCWRIEDPEEAVGLLENLHDLILKKPEAFVLNWPEGERIKLRGTASWQRLKLSITTGSDWFSLQGELKVSDQDVLSLQRLLELLPNAKGRFIQLAEGEFLALTEDFRRRLDDLHRLLDRHGKEQRIHILSAPLLEESLAGAEIIKGDKSWKSALELFNKAQSLQPVVPPTFQAEMRDYQQEGYIWLCRLAHWGVGACLADDMGLGKTIQALALLLNRAPGGPSLVLAPTSVCLNWESETRRFAPTLNPRIFGPGDRKQFIASLQPFDLVICSYTLLQQESELLTDVQWETAVLDEAQAIKNMTTKRSQAAMQLKARFKIATTGTPVENRLDELWNLFRFLNHGLLGSQNSFNQRFAVPIERDNSKTARTLLKKLIRPFILRRTKSQVLEELPPRTDIIQRIELTVEEAAFYEALRRKAVEKLDTKDEQGSGERQIRILAEIMRLRRACCSPQLVMPDCDVPSSKLSAFLEIVAELRNNGHRALVFSQFVDHLAILCKSLDKEGIEYQYLDGSTPAKERQNRVNAFQAGAGDLFLISLKAGGTGLNLTAADYVIHVDPWWNPAVEDQASDRAHRIGQQRPVTVYRLVAANTIEEKIVAMHTQKRDLANSLLEGTESAARVSADDLLELLREAG